MNNAEESAALCMKQVYRVGCRGCRACVMEDCSQDANGCRSAYSIHSRSCTAKHSLKVYKGRVTLQGRHFIPTYPTIPAKAVHGYKYEPFLPSHFSYIETLDCADTANSESNFIIQRLYIHLFQDASLAHYLLHVQHVEAPTCSKRCP